MTPGGRRRCIGGSAHGGADQVLHVYAVAGEAGLHVIDVSDAYAPQVVGAFDPEAAVEAVAVRDGYAFLTGSLSGGGGDLPEGILYVVDVHDPAEPREVDTVALPSHTLSNLVAGDGTLYVGLADCAYFSCTGELLVIDVRDPANPQQVASLPVTGGVLGLAIGQERIYLAAGEEGVALIDVADPGRPRRVVGLDTPVLAQSLAVDGERLYVADDAGGLLILVVEPIAH
jgi:hypothetical protein